MSIPFLRRRPSPRPRPVASWRRLRRGLLAAAFVAALLAIGYFVWLRDSALVSVERIEVTGANLVPAVETRLTRAASGMSTLHVDRERLEAAVAGDPSVIGIEVETDFPHGMRIEVTSRRPASYLDRDGGTVLAADGVVLATGAERPEGLPEIDARPGKVGDRVSGPALAAARVVGAIPAPLAPQVEVARVDAEHGPVVEMKGGLELRFGSPARAADKWHAAAAVLADPELTEARYIDLSAPSRPAVG